jgi:hypothetical protein
VFFPASVRWQVGVLTDLIFFLSLASSVLLLEPFSARASRAPPESRLGIFRVCSSLPASWLRLANGSTPPKLLISAGFRSRQVPRSPASWLRLANGSTPPNLLISAGFRSRQVPRSDFVLAPFLPLVCSVFISVSWSAPRGELLLVASDQRGWDFISLSRSSLLRLCLRQLRLLFQPGARDFGPVTVDSRC